MTGRTRRAYLAGVATAGAGVAGCLEDGGSGSPTGTSPRGSGAPSDADSPTGTAAPDRLVLDVVDAASAAADAPLTVYPGALRRWLRRAARTDETVRGHDDAGVYTPRPVLPQFETIRLASAGDEVDGTYDLAAEGGTRYRLLVGADPVDPPADATVTPVEELPERRRAFARMAISPEHATVYPETPLGEWVRHEFFGGYFDDDGEAYLGTEVQQTDAAFFSTTAWYVLSLSPVEAADPAVLRCPDASAAATEAVDAALDGVDEGTTRATYDGELSDAVVRFAGRTAYLLTHDRVFAVSVE